MGSTFFFCLLVQTIMSSELTWQLIRKHNCFIRRRNGVTFSAEPNNLTNKHAFKWSGLANPDAVGVDFNRMNKETSNVVVFYQLNQENPLTEDNQQNNGTKLL